MEFETVAQKKSHRDDDEDSDDSYGQDDRVPVYLGISLHEDITVNVKLQSIFKQVGVLLEDHKSSVIEANVKALQDVWLHGKNDSAGWRKPDDYHVTCLFMGKDEDKKQSPIYQSFANGVEVPVTIYAFVLVPNKIVTGICFPDYPVENRCPHVTLMVNEWKPVMSNSVLEAACTRGTSSPFAGVYEELRKTGTWSQCKDVLTGQIKINRDGMTNSCYIVRLEEPVTFVGLTKTYY